MYGRASDILRALGTEPKIDADVAKEWQGRGVALNVPSPSLRVKERGK